MFQIVWGKLFQLAAPGLTVLFFFFLSTSSRRKWVQAVAQALGGEITGRGTIEGQTAGFPWKIRLTVGLMDRRPVWHVTFPSLATTSVVIRAEDKGDRSWMRRGFVKELTVGDASFDSKHLLVCARPEQAVRLLREPGVRAAVEALEMDAARWEHGRITWVQLGQGLEAALDISRVDSTVFAKRLAELFQQVLQLARALQEAPARGTPGGLPARVLDTYAELRWVTLTCAIAMPVAISLVDGVFALTGTVYTARGLLALVLWGLGVGGLLGATYVWLARGQPTFYQRATRFPLFLVLTALGSPYLVVLLNASLPGVEAEPRRVQVTMSAPDRRSVLAYWRLDLEGLGELPVEWERGERFKARDEVRVRVASGALGFPRVLEVQPSSEPPRLTHDAVP